MHMQEWFIAGRPVSGKFFYGRKNEIETITAGFGNNYAIIGIRRVGKTSLLIELEEDFKKKGIIPIRINVQSVLPFTIENFLREWTLAVADGYAHASKNRQLLEKTKMFIKGRWDGFLEYVKGVHVKSHRHVLELWFEYEHDSEKSQTRLVKDVIEYPEKLARETGKKVVIMLDEFQDVQKLGTDFMKAFRSGIQETRNTSYIISGSAVGTMKHVLGSRKSPFFGMFLLQELGPLDEESARKLLRRVNDFGVVLPKELEDEVIELTGCYPLYLQVMGKIITVRMIVLKRENARSAKTTHENVVTREDLKECWMQLFSELSFHFQGLEKEMNGREKRIMETGKTHRTPVNEHSKIP